MLLGFRSMLDALTVDGILLFGFVALAAGALIGGFVGMMIGFRFGQRDGRRAAELHRREHWVDLIEESVAERSDRRLRRQRDTAAASGGDGIGRPTAPQTRHT